MPILPLNQLSGMPQMGAAFAGWMTNITVVKITQASVNGFIQNTEVQTTFRGTVQPLSPEELQLKPEGQRSWEWLQIHCFKGTLNLKTNDRIVYNGLRFKVMEVKDYSLNNYIMYHVVKDYQDES